MIEQISLLRKIVKLKIPQNYYNIASIVMKQGRVISQDYVGNDIIMEAEIPTSIEHKVFNFIID